MSQGKHLEIMTYIINDVPIIVVFFFFEIIFNQSSTFSQLNCTGTMDIIIVCEVIYS
jgi:hypothetical protein